MVVSSSGISQGLEAEVDTPRGSRCTARAPQAHGVRAVATISGQTPAHDPKMYPPEQPVEPKKTLESSWGFVYGCQ